ncbi:MAG TPA: hypothetical protein DCS09_04695 [Porphyromonadaceae bacterium]|nr:hypothetical protein [Porphyromonadaceae bacterium]
MQTYQFSHPVDIVNLGDIHRGNNNCDTNLLRKNIQQIADNPNMYWISTGDMLETAIKSSKSSCYEASTPEEELDALSLELEPIRLKCLGFTASNHQNRIKKEVGLSLDKILADRAQIPYLGIAATIKVTCGRCSYFIAMHHGVGGGTAGNKVNRAVGLAQNWLGADIYFTGHTHSFAHVTDIQTIIDRKRDKMTEIVTHHITTGHYLQYKGSYAEDLGLKAKPRGSAVVSLGFNEVGKQELKRVGVGFIG